MKQKPQESEDEVGGGQGQESNLFPSESLDVKDHLSGWPRKDEDMLEEGARDGEDEPGVGPGREGEERLALGDGVERVEHLDGHEDGEREGARPLVMKDLATVPAP
eukprot:765244-Hanusia_phi.AAC.1